MSLYIEVVKVVTTHVLHKSSLRAMHVIGVWLMAGVAACEYDVNKKKMAGVESDQVIIREYWKVGTELMVSTLNIG